MRDGPGRLRPDPCKAAEEGIVVSDQIPNKLNVLGKASDRASDFDAMRERAAAGLEAALAFVEEHGNELARLRARILVELEPLDRGLALLASRQQPNGSFPRFEQVLPDPPASQLSRWDPSGATVGTLEAISVLCDWEHLCEPSGDSAIEFLSQVQASDGSWGSAPTTTDDAASGDSSSGIFLTGCTAGFLGRSRTARPEVLKAAGAYLGAFWSVEFIRSNGWPAVAGFAHYFTNVFDEEGEAALPWCARELDRGRRVGVYSPVEVLRVLFYCQASALPGVDFDTNGLLNELLQQQLDDGSVGSPELPQVSRVASSLDAMLFMLRLCRSGGQKASADQ